MAIVDIKHTQTIEEAFKSVAEGGSGGGGSTETVEFTFPDPMSDEFVCNKTYAELVAMQTAGTLPAYVRVNGQPFAVRWWFEDNIARMYTYWFNFEAIDQGSIAVSVGLLSLTANGEQGAVNYGGSWSVTSE